jgi:hypothetical protein
MMEVAMKRGFWGVAVVVTGLMLGGCATTGGSSSASSSRMARGDRDNIDQEKIVSVNKWANDRGHDVTWVNLPRKPRKAEE